MGDRGAHACRHRHRSVEGERIYAASKGGREGGDGRGADRIDLDYVATNAKSLLTEVIISNGERVTNTVYGTGTAVVGKTPVLTLTLNGAAAAAGETETGPTMTSEAIILPNPNGLHARPAAVLSSVAKTFKSDIRLQLGDRSANARSVTSLLALSRPRWATRSSWWPKDPTAKRGVRQTHADDR